MTVNTVYQTVKYEVVALKDPELDTELAKWGIDSVEQFVPAETLSQLRDDNSFAILNTSTNAIGVIDPVNLAIYFNEYHPSEGTAGILKTFMEKVIEGTNKLEDTEESDDFYRGMNAVVKVFYAAQHPDAEGHSEDVEVHNDAV